MTDRLIALSPTELAEAIDNRIVPATKTALIENGIQFPILRQRHCSAPQRNAGARAGPLVGTVARFTPQKGPFDFVRMVAALAKRIPEVNVVWCGDGELRAEVQSLANDLGVANRLHLLGYRTDVLEVMAATDLFVLTSSGRDCPTRCWMPWRWRSR